MDLKGWPSWRGKSYEAGPQAFMLSLGLKSHAGLILGGGISTDPVSTAVASQKMASFYTKSTGSGDSEGLYWRHYIALAGAGGNAMRAYATVQAVAAANARGIHGSLSFSAYATSYVTGEGRAIKATLHIPSGGAMPANGTYSALQGEIYLDGTTSDPSAVEEMAILDLTVSGGDAAAQYKVKNFLSAHVPTGEEADARMHVSTITAATLNAACTEALRCKINGNVRWIPLATAVT